MRFKSCAVLAVAKLFTVNESDVVQVNHIPEKEALTFDLELQPIFSLPVDPVGTIRYDPLEGVHFDQDTTTTSSSTARMSNSLISQHPREVQVNAEQSSDTKISQADFWKENADGATFINTTCSSKINSLPKDNAPQWSTVFVGHTSPVRQNAYYSLVSPRQLHPYQHGETFVNAHVEACFVSSSSQSTSELPLNSMYDSIHNPSVTTVLVVSTPYSVDTTAGNTGVYGNTHTATGLLFPSVMFHPQPPTFLPQKYPCINPVPDFSSITTNVNRLSLDISPDITVLPLNFCEALPVYDPPRTEIREFSKTPKMNTTQEKRNTDDDCGTYL
ncbi:unnamed protein product [Dicrocoelium dendriticum]|nr:unnamed protein product [Dicrocoelium dendriticum]